MTRRCRISGKHRHASMGAARAHLRALQKLHPDYHGHAFCCPFCGGFHVGRLKKNAHRNGYHP